MGITPDNPGLFWMSLWLNPFPLNESAFRDGLWWKWIERVMLSHGAHVDDIEKDHGRHKRYVNQQHMDAANDLFIITEYMYASILVAAQSKIEDFFKHACHAAYLNANRTKKLYAINSNAKTPYHCKPDKVQNYLMRHCSLDIEKCEYYEFVNVVRILSNVFKHKGFIYNSDGESGVARDRIQQKLAKTLDIVDGQPVRFSSLPIGELLQGCGLYCANLQHQLMLKFGLGQSAP